MDASDMYCKTSSLSAHKRLDQNQNQDPLLMEIKTLLILNLRIMLAIIFLVYYFLIIIVILIAIFNLLGCLL